MGKWFLLVLFLEPTYDGADSYIFTGRPFSTKAECIASGNYEPDIYKYVQVLMKEFNGQVPKIRKIRCIPETFANELINAYRDQGIAL